MGDKMIFTQILPIIYDINTTSVLYITSGYASKGLWGGLSSSVDPPLSIVVLKRKSFKKIMGDVSWDTRPLKSNQSSHEL